MLELVVKEMPTYVSEGIRAGRMTDQAAGARAPVQGHRSVSGSSRWPSNVAGPEGAAWTEGDSGRP